MCGTPQKDIDSTLFLFLFRLDCRSLLTDLRSVQFRRRDLGRLVTTDRNFFFGREGDLISIVAKVGMTIDSMWSMFHCFTINGETLVTSAGRNTSGAFQYITYRRFTPTDNGTQAEGDRTKRNEEKK